MVHFDATKETILLPGDVVEVKLKRNSGNTESSSTEAGAGFAPKPNLSPGGGKCIVLPVIFITALGEQPS